MTLQPLNLVPFVSVDHMMRLVHAVGIEPFLVGLAGAIEADFLRWEAFERVARVASHSAGGVIELMPTSDGAVYGFKYVNGHPGNARDGRQTVAAFGMLADVATGYPLLLSEMTLLTAFRTAATSALAARWLAPPGAGVHAIIGNGAQCEFQALAFRALCGVGETRLWDVDPAATAKAAANLRAAGMRVVACRSAGEALEGARLVTTCTADKARARVLGDNMVGAGTHVNAVGGDCPGKTELAPELLLRAEIFAEHLPQTRVEGELQQMPADHPATELWRVMAGRAPGRSSAGAVTLFDSVGFAIEDFSALRHVRTLLAETGLGEPLDLVADPDDPRDLFGMLLRAG